LAPELTGLRRNLSGSGGSQARATDTRAPTARKEREMQQEVGPSSRPDFDFWIGHWQQRNWPLREQLAGCEESDEYESTSIAWTLDGLDNVDEYRTDYAGGYVGMSVRVFDPHSRSCTIHWADSRSPDGGRSAGSRQSTHVTDSDDAR
jgi:hypothetical protein